MLNTEGRDCTTALSNTSQEAGNLIQENHALKEADRPKATFQNPTGIQLSHTYEQKEHTHITQCEQGSQAEIRQECSVLYGSLEIVQLRPPITDRGKVEQRLSDLLQVTQQVGRN